MALEASGMDIAATKKLIGGLIDQAQIKLEKAFKDDYDRKLKEVNATLTKLNVKVQPVAELTLNGKSLPMAILEHILSGDGVATIIDKAKHDIVQSELMKARFVSFDALEAAQRKMKESFEQIQIQLGDFETNRKQFMLDVGNLKHQFESYVKVEELDTRMDDVVKRLDKYAPWEAVRNVLTEFDGYVKTATLMEYMEEQDDRLHKVDEALAERLTQEQATEQRYAIEAMLHRTLELYLSRADHAQEKKD